MVGTSRLTSLAPMTSSTSRRSRSGIPRTSSGVNAVNANKGSHAVQKDWNSRKHRRKMWSVGGSLEIIESHVRETSAVCYGGGDPEGSAASQNGWDVDQE